MPWNLSSSLRSCSYHSDGNFFIGFLWLSSETSLHSKWSSFLHELWMMIVLLAHKVFQSLLVPGIRCKLNMACKCPAYPEVSALCTSVFLSIHTLVINIPSSSSITTLPILSLPQVILLYISTVPYPLVRPVVGACWLSPVTTPSFWNPEVSVQWSILTLLCYLQISQDLGVWKGKSRSERSLSKGLLWFTWSMVLSSSSLIGCVGWWYSPPFPVFISHWT